jgi:pyruvate ferredoxin oxidoreductase gamma subunit
MKTAGRILGTAFFLEGFEVQDAPRYGAERRGAPLFAYVRASLQPIHERGIIRRPDLVVIADDSLVGLPAAEVLSGVTNRTVLLINTDTASEIWKRRLNLDSLVIGFHTDKDLHEHAVHQFLSSWCAAAAARLTGVISRVSLETAVRQELAFLPSSRIEENLLHAEDAFDALEANTGCVMQGEEASAENYERPDWIDLPVDEAVVSAPVIHAGFTSSTFMTGLWRTFRPVIDMQRCRHCWWICSSFCPDSAIRVSTDGIPEIDYDHCKGCLICAAQCPSHAIRAEPEVTGKEPHDQTEAT